MPIMILSAYTIPQLKAIAQVATYLERLYTCCSLSSDKVYEKVVTDKLKVLTKAFPDEVRLCQGARNAFDTLVHCGVIDESNCWEIREYLAKRKLDNS